MRRATTADESRESYVAFVECHQHRLLGAAYLVCGNRHQAEDLLQDALLKLALRWPSVRQGDPAAYVRTVLYRDAVSWWRRRRREWLSEHPPEQVVRDPDDALRIALHEALRHLPPRQRAVVVLRYFEDLTEAATAEVLGVSVGTVKSQCHAALRRLREVAPDPGRSDASGGHLDQRQVAGERRTDPASGMEVTP